MKRILKHSSGFSMVGVLVASTIGVIAVLGFAQLSVNVIGTLNRAKQELNLLLLSEEMRHTLQQDDACNNSLGGFNVYSESFLAIRDGAGSEVYKGGQVWRGVKIQAIRFKPQSADKATVVVQFSLSDDTRETLLSPKPLNFKVFIDEEDSGHIKKCTIAGTVT